MIFNVPQSFDNPFLHLDYTWYSLEDWMATEKIKLKNDALRVIWKESLIGKGLFSI